MSVRAVHRLSEFEVLALGDAFGELVRVEAELVAGLGDLRRAAELEAQARRSRNLPGLGAYGEGYRAARQVLAALAEAPDALSTQG